MKILLNCKYLSVDELIKNHWRHVTAAAYNIISLKYSGHNERVQLANELSQRCAEWLLTQQKYEIENAYKMAVMWMKRQTTWTRGSKGSFAKEIECWVIDNNRSDDFGNFFEESFEVRELEQEDRENLNHAVSEFIKTLPKAQQIVYQHVFVSKKRVADAPVLNPFGEYRRLKISTQTYFKDSYI